MADEDKIGTMQCIEMLLKKIAKNLSEIDSTKTAELIGGPSNAGF